VSISLYLPGNTFMHRLPAGVKMLALLVAGVGLFVFSNLVFAGAAAVIAALLLASVRPPLEQVRRQLGGAAIILAVVFVTTGLFESWHVAVVSMLRLLALLLFALAVTLTTRTSALLDTCEAALRPLDRLRIVNTAYLSLAVPLTLRFIPELSKHYAEIREAQAARGLQANPVALVVPLIVRTLRSADDVAAAIDARCFPPVRSSTREGDS
jgi:biotin transport system permease protein